MQRDAFQVLSDRPGRKGQHLVLQPGRRSRVTVSGGSGWRRSMPCTVAPGAVRVMDSGMA